MKATKELALESALNLLGLERYQIDAFELEDFEVWLESVINIDTSLVTEKPSVYIEALKEIIDYKKE